jgi:prepilin-type N-terminal cleavage/methylation domain-containing protein
MRKGFTLLELMITVAIILVLFVVISKAIYDRVNESHAYAYCSLAYDSIMKYYNDKGSLPTSLQNFLDGTDPDSSSYVPLGIRKKIKVSSDTSTITLTFNNYSFTFPKPQMKVTP